MSELYETVFNKMHTAAALIQTGKIVAVNSAFEKHFQIAELSQVLAESNIDLESHDLSDENKIFYEWLTDSDGGKIYVQIHKLLLDKEKEMSLLEVKSSEDALLSREVDILSAYSRELFNKSLHAIAFLDRKENVLDINPQFENLFGYRKDEILGQDINDFIIPDGFETEIEALHKKIFDNESFIVRIKRKNKNGELIDVEAAGSPVFINGEIYGLFAMYQDRRVETHALQELKRERAYFKQLFDNSPDAIVLLDDHDSIIDFNKSFEHLFGYSLEEVKGICIDEIIGREEYTEEVKAFARALIREGKTIKAETVRFSKEGRKLDVELLAYPIYLDEDRLGAYAFYRDISDRKSKEQEIKSLIYRDSLTGIYNRKYAYETLYSKLEEAKEEKGIVSFLYFDLEDFKKVNDTKGHTFGDVLLAKIARRIKEYFSDRLEVCRVGGDEFLAIINDPYSASIQHYIDELKGLFDKNFLVKGEKIKSDLSVGYAVYPEDGKDLDELIYRADKRMYREKNIERIKKNPVRKTTTVEELMKEND